MAVKQNDIPPRTHLPQCLPVVMSTSTPTLHSRTRKVATTGALSASTYSQITAYLVLAESQARTHLPHQRPTPPRGLQEERHSASHTSTSMPPRSRIKPPTTTPAISASTANDASAKSPISSSFSPADSSSSSSPVDSSAGPSFSLPRLLQLLRHLSLILLISSSFSPADSSSSSSPICRSLFFSSEIVAVAPTLFDEMEWDNGEGDYPNVNDCYEENNDSLDESSDDEVFINRNCLVILGMMLKDINKYVDKDIMENNEQKDDARRILLHDLMTSNEQPDGSEIPPLIQSSSRFYPYFKDCVGALDGTHIRVKVFDEDSPRYRGRKDWPTTNVLVVCSFDLKFTYILSGWEGTASDS
ncbi:hypothetical protein ZIOFF_051682 [Zingiber officinale]|uniref:DDE Tnp4 domain-containing protein n=1 Tax=Zingiber officinale TaxID=94328 RepID=A0A8J5FRL3_ZINOF|nr:hypothetical protein ZIOFF_051682 [Zingiber officinale]